MKGAISANKKRPTSTASKISAKLKRSPNRFLGWLMRAGLARLRGKYYGILKRIRTHHVDRIVLPWLLARRTFLLNNKENTARLSSQGIDSYIFCDEAEAKVASNFFAVESVHVARYPTQGVCRCQANQTEKKSAVLIVLSTGVEGGARVRPENLPVYFREIKTVLAESGATEIHLRPHPRDGSGWPEHLAEFLRSKGIKATCKKNEQPIREIICDYRGVAGFASSTLRDARAACDYVFSVGFLSISKYMSADPKFWFGKSEGIGWIEEDGSYDPAIFKRERYSAPARPALPDILEGLANKHEVKA